MSMEKKPISPKIKPNRHVRQLRLEAKIDGRKSIKKKAIFSMPVAPAELEIEQKVTAPELVTPVIIDEEPVTSGEIIEGEVDTENIVSEVTEDIAQEAGVENHEYTRESKIIDGKGKESLFDSMESFTLETGDTVLAGSDKGIDYKDHNEDRAVVCPKENLVMIIDGVGGSSDGERAAQILAEATLKNPQKKVDDIVLDTVEEMKKQDVGNSSAVFISARILEESGKKFVDISQIGDAKLIIINKHGEVTFETEDGNMLSRFIKLGSVDPDKALYETQPVHFITPDQISLQKTDPFTGKKSPKTFEDMGMVTQKVELKEGDFIVSYSDGIGNNFTSREIAAVKKDNDFTPTQLFKWISDKTTERMKDKEKILGTTPEEKEEILKDRKEKGHFSDGFKSRPKPDNRSLAIIEIKNNGKQTDSPESVEVGGELSEDDIANLSDEELDSLLAQYEEEEVVSAEKPEVIPESRPDTETVTMMIRGKQETASIDSLTDKEKEDIFRQTEIHGDEFDGKKLTLEILRENGLLPEKKITIDGNTIWFSSEPYDLSGDRIAIMAYVRDKNNKITARSYYRSNSQGVWRYLPSYLIRDGKINWYHKGHSEESITLPAICQMALAQITEGQKAKKVNNPELVFTGTAKDIMHYKEGTYLFEIKEKPIDLGFSSKQGKKLAPEEISFSGKNSELSPDFYTGRNFAKWTQNSDKYGQIEIEVLPSRDGQLKFMFCRDTRNRVWIGGIENDSKIGSTGLKETWVNGGDLTTPALEYNEQAGGYGNLAMSSGEYVDMFTNYLSKIPIIIEYCRSRIIPLPVPPPKRDTEPEIGINRGGVNVFDFGQKETPPTPEKTIRPGNPDLGKRINMPIPTPKPPEIKKPEAEIFSMDFVKKEITRLLESNENIKKVLSIEVNGKDKEITLNTRVLAGPASSEIEISCILKNQGSGIKVTGTDIKAGWLIKGMVEKLIKPKLAEVSDILKTYIESNDSKERKVEKMEIKDGQLVVNFK